MCRHIGIAFIIIIHVGTRKCTSLTINLLLSNFMYQQQMIESTPKSNSLNPISHLNLSAEPMYTRYIECNGTWFIEDITEYL